MAHHFLVSGPRPECIQQLRTLADEHAFVMPSFAARFHSALALVHEGHYHEGLRRMRETLAQETILSRMQWLHFASLYLEACVIAKQTEEGIRILKEIKAISNRMISHMDYAEEQRLEGELLLLRAQQTPRRKRSRDQLAERAEQCFQQSLQVSQRQKAKFFELRATMSLARLRQQQGRARQASQQLSKVYNWFTEGFDTKDLKDAKALLDELT